MKKRIVVILLALVMMVGLLAGCSGASENATMDTSDGWYGGDSYTGQGGSAKPEADMEYSTSDTPGIGTMDGSKTENGSGTLADRVNDADFEEKLIYTANARVETVEFDKAIEELYKLVEFYGGFVENSYVTGSSYRENYYGYQTYRYAEFTIRVPSQGFKEMTENLGALGNVTSLTSGLTNITEQFYDAQSRLDTYAIEEERLLSMLEKAETVSDMIELESRISQVRYEIEALESRLRNWQNQVDYSTVTVYINEVEELTPIVETQRTYWQQVGDGLAQSLLNIGRFFKNFFKDLVAALPVLAILAAVGAVAFVILRKIVRKITGKVTGKIARKKKGGDTSEDTPDDMEP